LKAQQFVHVLDNNTGVTRLEVGPQTITLGDRERLILKPEPTKNLLSQLKEAQLVQAKAEFEAELEVFQTQQGIWDDLTTLYILGRKPES
jgi:hypothetical protein